MTNLTDFTQDIVKVLLATKDPAEKAAIIADLTLSELPERVVFVVCRCIIFHWFDQSIIEALLKEFDLTQNEINNVYEQIEALPFIEKVSWGLTFQDLTREGLLKRYTSLQPDLLRSAALQAASVYETHNDDKIVAEAAFCYALANKELIGEHLTDKLTKRALERGDQQFVDNLQSLLDEAKQISLAIPTPRTGRLQNKRVIVTGASGFIGRAIVSICLAEGAAVLAFDKVPFEHTWVENVSTSHLRLVSMLGDITSQTDCMTMAETGIGSLGGIDILINTVGIMEQTDGGPLETPIDTWDRTMAVNIKGIWLSCAASIPFMLQQGSGSIVNVGSLVGMRGSSIPQIAYTTSKGALIALTRELAVHLAPQNIRVNIVCPGPLEGGLLADKLTSDTSVRKRTEHIPMGRLGRAQEVAQACVYLASDESSFITGVELPVDGGASASFIC